VKLLKQLSIAVLLLSGLFAVSATPSFGQIHLTLSAADTNSTSCMDEVAAFKKIASRYPRPAAWHFIIVCEETSWKTVLSNLHQYDPRYEVYGSTYLDSGVTYLRGWKLTHTSASDPSPDRIIAHEDAHIYLHSTDDEKVESLAQKWVKQSGQPWTGPEAVTSTEAALSHKDGQ
jgi:hypothetical protein